MRILHVSEVHWGGVVTLLRHFTAEQMRNGDDVHLLAPDAFPHLPGVERHAWTLDRARPSSYLSARSELRRTVQQVRPDVVHLHSFLGGFFGRLPGAMPGRAHPWPVVYQPHAWAFDLSGRFLVRLVIRTWERYAADRTHRIVANCQDEVDEGRCAGVDQASVVLGVAVDLEAYQPVSQDGQQDHRQALGTTAPRLVVCIGRLAPQKGQDLLLAAWERNPLPDTVLILVGPGSTEHLEIIAATQWGRSVIAVGEHADVRPWIWASDLLVMPSRYETVGLVVAEAMACGRPVVTTRVNGVHETLIGPPLPPAGAVVPLGRMDELLDEVARRLDDPQLRLAEGARARERAEAMFRPAAVAERLHRAYTEAIGSAAVSHASNR